MTAEVVTKKEKQDGKIETIYGLSGIAKQLCQICVDYNGLGNFRDLYFHEISFFYEYLVPSLLSESQEPKK